MKTSYLFLAPGFEEIEALTTVDVMRRAGMDIKTVAVNNINTVSGAHGIPVVADLNIADMDVEATSAEWLILPGGLPGADNLRADEKVCDLLLAQRAKGGKIAAICASPAVVLAPLGLLDDREATCYPGFEKKCTKAIMRDTPVMALNDLITGNGPASSLRFALAIVASSMGEGIAREVGSGMLFYPAAANFYF